MSIVVKKTFAAYQTVRIIGTEYERFGQVGVAVGPGQEPDEVTVKFENESGKPGDPQQVDSFPVDAVEAI